MKRIINSLFVSIVILGFMAHSGCKKLKDNNGLPVDGDGNEYDTVVIGTQVWLKQNLKTTKYRNGDQIYQVTENSKWTSWQTGAYCWYDNKPDYKDTYGALYNWKAASTDFLCPVGWHIPTRQEWIVLVNFLGGFPNAGGKLKETGSIHWVSQSEGTTNESGFTAVPGGSRYLDGTFSDIKQHGYWWTTDFNWFFSAHSTSEYVSEGGYFDGNPGCSVRCIKSK